MEQQNPGPGKWQLFRIWANIGLQSFGGGASTIFLIQRAFTEKHKWMSIDEFTHFWSLCIPTPGINLVAVTILIGRKFGGIGGIFVSLAGLLIPSAIITCLLAALFQHIETLPAVQATIRGIIPATGAIMLLVGLNFAGPLLRKSSKEGIFVLLASCTIIVLCALAVILFKTPAIVVVLGAIVLGALFFAPKQKPGSVSQQGDEQQ